jgi:hypothetical protein
LRTGDKSRDGVIESEDRNFARQIGIRPGNRKRSQGSRSEESRYKKDKDAAEIRRQHRDRVQDGTAFKLYSSFVYAREGIHCWRRDVERNFRWVH